MKPQQALPSDLPATDLQTKAKSEQIVQEPEKDSVAKNTIMDIVKVSEPDDDESLGDVVVTNLCNLVI